VNLRNITGLSRLFFFPRHPALRKSEMSRIHCLVVIVFVSLVFVAGCSTPSRDLPDLATVSGTVTMDGKPLSRVSVFFESANGHGAAGTTDQNGRYELYFSGDTKGAEVGANTVRITTVLDFPTPPDYRDPIPAKYNSSSELTVTVQPGTNTHDFALTR